MKKILLIAIVLLSSFCLFGLVEAKDVVSVEIVNDTLQATFAIPEGLHQTIQEDYFYLDIDPIEGVTFEKTIYPEGEPDIDGYINLHGTVKLTKKFTIADGIDRSKIIIKAYTSFQLCYESYCEPPVESEFSLPLKPEIKKTVK